MIDKHQRFMDVIKKYDPDLRNWRIHKVYRYGGQDYEDYSHLYRDEFEVPESKFGTTNCICSHPNCIYLASIINTKGDILDPVGSSCIERFNRPDLMVQLKIKTKQFEMDLVDYFKEYHLYPKVDFKNIPYQDFEYDVIQFFRVIPYQDYQYNHIYNWGEVDDDENDLNVPQEWIDKGKSKIFHTQNPKYNDKTFWDMYKNHQYYIKYIKKLPKIAYNLMLLIQYSNSVDVVMGR
jgi:hypothetical protein